MKKRLIYKSIGVVSTLVGLRGEDSAYPLQKYLRNLGRRLRFGHHPRNISQRRSPISAFRYNIQASPAVMSTSRYIRLHPFDGKVKLCVLRVWHSLTEFSEHLLVELHNVVQVLVDSRPQTCRSSG